MLSALEDVSTVPDPPQAAMLHALVRRPLEPLREATLDLAEETSVWFAGHWSATDDPAVQRVELTVTGANLEVPLSETRDLWTALLERARA